MSYLPQPYYLYILTKLSFEVWIKSFLLMKTQKARRGNLLIVSTTYLFTYRPIRPRPQSTRLWTRPIKIPVLIDSATPALNEYQDS